MKYRRLGKTGWDVSVLGYGAYPLGGGYGKFSAKEGRRAVRTALDLGINFIDVSPACGSAAAEFLLGQALEGTPRERFYLSTKVGRYSDGDGPWDFSAERVQRSVDESLRRLRVSHLDLILCEDVDHAPPRQLTGETIPALQELKRQGKVRKIGLSGFPLRVLRKALGETAVDVVLSYGHYCLHDITLVQMFPVCKARRVGIINAAALGMGLLTEQGPPVWHPAPKLIRDLCARAAAHARQRKGSLAKLALQFAVANPVIATTLVGSADPAEVKANVRALDEPFDPALLAEVQEILAPIRNQDWPHAAADPSVQPPPRG